MAPGERIREERLEREMSQLALGKKAGVTKQAVSRIELGHTKEPEATTLEPLCRALGLNMRWVLKGIDPKYIQSGAPALTVVSTHKADPIDDIRAILLLSIEAVASALPHAGAAVAEQLRDPDSPLRDSPYARDVLEALDTLLQPQALHDHAPPTHTPNGR